jgi:hypothetical protein
MSQQSVCCWGSHVFQSWIQYQAWVCVSMCLRGCAALAWLIPKCCAVQALASLAVGSEAARQAMVDSRIVPILAAALAEADAGTF